MKRLAVVGLLASVVACSSQARSPKGGADVPSAALSDGAGAAPRPVGPAADVSAVLAGGNGPFLRAAAPVDLPPGWVEDERVAAGSATSYRAVGELGGDGRYVLVADRSANYRTRIVVRRPPSEKFNGTVVVEWLNVTGGVDEAPDFTYSATELFRRGYAWVGVSAQVIAIEGGPVALGGSDGVAGVGLRTLDPARYGDLSHPGDAFAYDIYTQVGRALRYGDGLGPLVPTRVLAVGESQAAIMLTTYINGVHPLAEAYDGFLIHSRFAAAAPLGEPGGHIDIAGSIGGIPTRIRDDLDAPVLTLETETDVLSFLNYYAARQDDSARFRLWEVAGTAHADRFLVGDRADLIDCGGPINAGPSRFVVRAALRALDHWVATGDGPAAAPRLDVDGAPAFRRDPDGIVLGGVRTPQVDVPVDVLSGEPRPNVGIACFMLGSTTPLPSDVLAERYETAENYSRAYTSATDKSIASGFVLEDDRDEVLAEAQPNRLGG